MSPHPGTEAGSYDLAIIGFGPAGATAANLAGRLGLRTLVVERDPDVFPRQRAIAMDDQALRVIRDIGLYDEVTARMHMGVTARFIGVDGRPILTTPTRPSDECRDPLANFFHQPWLESTLRGGVTRFDNVEVLLGHEGRYLAQNDDCVTLGLDAVGESVPLRQVRASYVLACDGGSSPTRKSLGVAFAGNSYSELWMDVQAKLRRPLAYPPHFDFICDPDRPGVRCPCPGGYFRWEWRINAGETPEQMLAPENIWRMLAADGITPDDIDIHRTWTYTFHVRKAAEWRIGRVLLAGDAAHVMPPFAGQGISGAIRDVANVAWKIGDVLAGRADDSLLDSYQSERQAHHDFMTRRAEMFGRIVMPPNRTVARTRDVLLRSLSRTPLGRYVVGHLAQPPALGPGFSDSSSTRNRAVGHLLKSVTVASPGIVQHRIDAALGPGWAILGLNRTPSVEVPQHILAAWETFDPRLITIRPGTSVVGDGEIGDPVGELWDWMQARSIRFAIVRPDRYIHSAAYHAADLPLPVRQRPSATRTGAAAGA